MVESVGKKLNQARVKRGLSIDEAAHATRLRPDKIAALENDDYSRFANNIYAKGFLQIYARFLGVDVSDFARTLDNANPISVSDYQYLSNAPTPRQEAIPVRNEERRPPSLAPLLFFLLIVAVGGGLLVFENVRSTAQRLERNHASDGTSSTTGEPARTNPSTPAPVAPTPLPASQAPVTSAPTAATPLPVPTAVPAFRAPGAAVPTPAIARVPSAVPTPAPANARIPVATPIAGPQMNPFRPGSQIPGAPTPIPPAAVAANPGSTPSRDQDFVTPRPVATVDGANYQAPASGGNEVLVATVKTTWVTVRKDNPKAPPIFEDNVYPSANPLKLKGSRFFIEVRGDPNDVQITKNGLPVTYQGADVPVQ
jgi:cytoskeletal protein RodZ